MITYPQYGPKEQYEPVIEELLASGPMQRLKNIHQLGVVHFINPAWSTKRYEHSLGVLMLLRKHGASLEEQVAGLLHDVSHMAFSHVADFLFERWDESLGDDYTHEWVTNGEIAEILTRHGIDPARVADPKQFGLLERDKPGICADRLDYSFRDAVSFGALTINEAKAFVDDLAVVDGEFVFKSKERATAFAKLYIALDREFYASPTYIASYFLMVSSMRNGLETGVLTVDDLWQDDDHVMRVLIDSDDPKISEPLHALMHGFDLDQMTDSPAYTLRKKVRYVDPKVIHEGELTPISHIDTSVKEAIEVYLQQREQPIAFSIITRGTCQHR